MSRKIPFKHTGEPSGSRSGCDLVFSNERTSSLPFLPLSLGEGHRLHHWSLITEEKGVGGTPSFRNEFIFWLQSVAVLFSSSPGFGISSSALRSRGLQLLSFNCWGQRHRRLEWLATRGWFRFLFSKFISVRYILLVPNVCVERLPRVGARDGQPAPKSNVSFVALRLRYVLEC